MEQDAKLLLRLIDAMPIPVVGIDANLRLTIWNAAAEREFGWSAAEVLGRRNPTIPRAIRAEYEDHVHRAIAGMPIRNVRSWRLRRDGTRADILLSHAVAGDGNGNGEANAVGVYFVLSAADAQRRDAERQLVECEAQLRIVLDELPAVVYTTDADLNVTTVRGAHEFCACLLWEVERNVEDLMEDDRTSGAHALRAVLAGAPVAHYTCTCGDRVFDARVEPLRSEDGSVSGTIVAGFDVTERHRAREAIRRMAEQLSTAQEDERRRIARELHDEMGQNLTALCFELNLLRAELGDTIPQERVDAIATLVRETTSTMRRVMADLRPPLLDDVGFCAAVKNELATLQRRYAISYNVELPKEEPPLDRARATALFRIIQESLTNVARHSAATRVQVSLFVGGGQVFLEVSDNGRGITTGEAAQTESFGLTGVRERAWAFGGDVSIEGTPGTGTRIRVRFPCTAG